MSSTVAELGRLTVFDIAPEMNGCAAAIIFNERDEVLLFHHTYRGEKYAWGLPGGWLKQGESVEAGIEREIYEESRLVVCIDRPFLVGKSTKFPRLDLVFLGHLVSGTFQSSLEVDDVAFFAQFGF